MSNSPRDDSQTVSWSSSLTARLANSRKQTAERVILLPSSESARIETEKQSVRLSAGGGRSGSKMRDKQPIHVHLHLDEQGSPTGDSLSELVAVVREVKEELMSVQETIDALKAKVEANTSATQSIVESYQALAQAIRDSKDDPEELEALAASIEANTNALTNAVTSNTVVEDEEETLPEDDDLGDELPLGDATPVESPTEPVNPNASEPSPEPTPSEPSVEVPTEVSEDGASVAPTEESMNQPESDPGATA